MFSRCSNLSILFAAFVALICTTFGAIADEPAKTLDIYCIDISASVGNATLIVRTWSGRNPGSTR